ncbi:hypothetical protein BT69DRAFT_1242251 [Atractiella rhizophila]|nr:hypothetical protein BT69DRAFT_1242251 [Atractiella rhizophila]
MSSTNTTDADSPISFPISDWERINYYHGISPDPPELLYRSDLQTNPFPIPESSSSYIPTKTVHGVFGTPLKAIWDDVCSHIFDLIEAREIRCSAIKTARFSTDNEDGTTSRGPVVIWIAVYPNSTTAAMAHDASQAILALLRDKEIEGVVVEWYEGVVQRL